MPLMSDTLSHAGLSLAAAFVVESVLRRVWAALLDRRFSQQQMRCPDSDAWSGMGISRFYPCREVVSTCEWGNCVNRMAVDALRVPYYSSRHPGGSYVP